MPLFWINYFETLPKNNRSLKHGISERNCKKSSCSFRKYCSYFLIYLSRLRLLTKQRATILYKFTRWHGLCINFSPQGVLGCPYCRISQETVRPLREVPDWAIYQEDFLHHLLSVYILENYKYKNSFSISVLHRGFCFIRIWACGKTGLTETLWEPVQSRKVPTGFFVLNALCLACTPF